jgi:hypothetical protein
MLTGDFLDADGVGGRLCHDLLERAAPVVGGGKPGLEHFQRGKKACLGPGFFARFIAQEGDVLARHLGGVGQQQVFFGRKVVVE